MNQAVNAKRDAFETAGFFVLRTPALTFSTLVDWAGNCSASAAHGTKQIEAAVNADRCEQVARLRDIMRRPEIQEALFLGSVTTLLHLQQWLDAHQRQDAKLERALARYLQRMAGRATPFGLFAGISTGQVAASVDLSISGASNYRRYSRLDNDYLFAVTEQLSSEEHIRRALTFIANPTLYHLAGRWRYVQALRTGSTRQFNLVALNGDEYLDATIARGKRGGSVEEFARHVVACDPDCEIRIDEAREYILTLVDRQVLISHLTPIVTGPEPLDEIIDQLKGLTPNDSATVRLEWVRQELRDLDRAPIGSSLPRYYEIANGLRELGTQPDLSRLIQVDLIKPAPGATLSHKIMEHITGAVNVLHRISPASGGDALRDFREAFVARYERRLVPLCEVLDEEAGIGFDVSTAASAENAPLVNGIPRVSSHSSPASWTSRDAFLLNRLTETWRVGSYSLELTADDVDRMSDTELSPLPDAFYVMGALSKSADDEHDWQVFVRGGGGPSGARLLGRFCHADAQLRAEVATHLQSEQSLRPNAVFAEIVHLPDGRVGNIVARPVLREFEIPYLGRSGGPEDKQLHVSELLVGVEGDRVVLRSKKLDREVLPRMTNAYNHRLGPGVYRFLCSLQSQDELSTFGWRWGVFESASFLPRVTYGRIVFARARWRIDKPSLDSLRSGALHEQFAAVVRWRTANSVPRFVTFVDGDNELPVDLENVLSVETFLHATKGRRSAVMSEMFPGPNHLCARGPEGAFVHELIVPFVKQTPHSAPAARAPQISTISRTFQPGTDWLYVKLYAGTGTIDGLLTEFVGPLIQRHRKSGAIDRWFFVRYSDPNWHLRLRLHGDPGRLRNEVLADISDTIAQALTDRRVWKVQMDTYDREIERYGGATGIHLSEELFCHDSATVLRLLHLLQGDEGMELRWVLGLRCWDILLTHFLVVLNAKRELMERARQSFATRFGQAKLVDRALGDKFRRHRRLIESVFEEREGVEPLPAALQVLRDWSAAIQPVTRAFLQEESALRLSVPVSSLVLSFLHMHANRLLRSAQTGQEFIMYDFINRIYASQAARNRSRQVQPRTSV